MKKKHPSKLEIAARIVVVVAVLCASIVTAFVSVTTAYATSNAFPVAVTASFNYSSGNAILTLDDSCDSTIDNGGGGEPHSYITLDYGAIYHVTTVKFHGGPNSINQHYTVEYSTDNSSWTSFGYDLINNGTAHCPFSSTTPDAHDTTQDLRYIRITEQGNASATFDSVEILYDETPTPTPTTAYATPFPPQPTACVTAMPLATATHQATPTPLVQRTPTPGGPTATPGPSATGTPVPSFDSGVADFSQSLQPWTATEHFSFGGLYVTEWRSDAGPDGNPGVAFTKDFAGLLDNPSGPLTTTEPLSGSLTFSRPSGMFFPFRVTGSVKWSTSILGGESAYLRAWYFDPDYISSGQGAWVTDPPNWRKQFGANWDRFSFSMVQHGGSGRVTAVAISEELDGTERNGEGAVLDNLRVYSGPQAVAGSFPVCQGSGAGSHPVITKVCIIKQISVDVMSRGCTAPTSLIDLWNWIVYAVCRVENYFTWFAENTQQINTLKDRQNADEPFGTFFEASDMIGVISGVIRDIGATYASNASEYRQINWHTFFDFRQLDAIANVFQVPNDPDVLARYRSRCPALPSEEMNSQLFAKYGCLVLTFTRDQLPVFGVWQWVIDVGSIIGLIIYAQRILSKR